MEMYIGGQWLTGPAVAPVVSPYSGEVVDTVPSADAVQVERSLMAATSATAAMAALSGYERAQILLRAADRIASSLEDIARTISLEEGKPLSEARGEVGRSPDLLRLCAFEGTQIRGESLQLDAQAATTGKLGFTLRVPCGVVVAISPFNYPLLLVLHKVGPALAAGNAVILKPSEKTPLTALKLTKILLESGLPENGLQCVTGPGHKIGPQLCADSRVRKITFTGSTEVGKAITQVTGIKRLSLELGSNCALVVLPDADLEKVADATAAGGYVNAGQVCISIQRVLVHRKVYVDFLAALKSRVEAIKVGPSLSEDSKLSAMVSEVDAERVSNWVRESVDDGARLVTGGERQRAVLAPTIVADVQPKMRIFRDELFGPAVAVTPVKDISEAISLANDSSYGLGAGIFTQNIDDALRFAKEVVCGNIMINWTPLWRADLMPYGGLKDSGIGKEGPRYAVMEMTESKTVVFHGIGK
jgi:acyl-CoA reductase-like NAD-dependent aldehyde dehydrogenase